MRALVLALVFAASAASGQDKPVTPPPQPPAAGVAPAPTYAYNPEGRRDPFVSLVKRAVGVKNQQGKAPAGVSGFLVSELVLKGILQSRGDHVALVAGPDNRTYMVRANHRLLDGSVRAITADTLVCLQDVNDPLSLTKQREVRLTLRAVADAK
jgi:Tfp pilus assembly protein PilP